MHRLLAHEDRQRKVYEACHVVFHNKLLQLESKFSNKNKFNRSDVFLQYLVRVTRHWRRSTSHTRLILACSPEPCPIVSPPSPALTTRCCLLALARHHGIVMTSTLGWPSTRTLLKPLTTKSNLDLSTKAHFGYSTLCVYLNQ